MTSLPAALQNTPGVSLSHDALIALRRVSLLSRGTPPLANLPGGFATRRKGHGQEVADVRGYVPGDDIRHLDRGTTARTGALHVRQFQEERDRVTLLLADFRPSMLWGLTRALRSVAAAEALSLIGWQIVEDGGRVGLLALGAGDPVIIAPRGRTRGMLDVIGGLVRAHEAALLGALDGVRHDPPLAGGLSRLGRLVPRDADVVIASGFDAMGDGFAEALARIARRHDPRLIAIGDGAGRLKRGIYPMRLNDGRRTRVSLSKDMTTPDVIDIAGVRAFCLDAGLPPTEMALRLSVTVLAPESAVRRAS